MQAPLKAVLQISLKETLLSPRARIAFMLSDATGTSVASREWEGSRALLFENEFVSKTLPG